MAALIEYFQNQNWFYY